MPSLHHLVAGRIVALRRIAARRPWIYWVLVVASAVAFGVSQRERGVAIDDARASWGETVEVLVAVGRHVPGDPLVAERREFPRAVVPTAALHAIPSDVLETPRAESGTIVRQRLADGEIVTSHDVAAAAGPTALSPPGRVVVPIEEQTASGVEVGESVIVVGDGLIVADDALVVGYHAEAVLLAVRRDEAAGVAAAATLTGVTLARIP